MKLKTCPFCTSKPNYSASKQDGYVGHISIYCRNCWCSLSGYDTEKDIEKIWNTRAGDKSDGEKG